MKFEEETTTICVVMPISLKEKLAKYSQTTLTPKNAIVRKALTEFLDKNTEVEEEKEEE